MFRTHCLKQLKTGDASSASAVQDDLYVTDFLTRNLERIDQTRSADHSRTMLIIVEDRDVHFFFEALFDDKTLGGFDIFEVDSTKRRPHQANRVAELIWVFRVKFNVDGIHVSEPFEQNCLSFHHWL